MLIDENNIFLTPITYADTSDIVRWRNTPFVQQNFICQEPFTRNGHIHWMKTMVETGRVVQFIIWERTSNKKIGSVYLRDIDYLNKKAEFGIFIGEKEYLGKGYGKIATNLIVSYAFSQLNLNKIFLRLLSCNERAYKCYLNAGFVQEGFFRQDVIIHQQPYDIIFMAIFSDTHSI